MRETFDEMEFRHARERREMMENMMMDCFEGNMGHLPQKYSHMAEVANVVAKRHRVSLVDLRSPTRTADLVKARWDAFGTLRKYGYTLDEIGRFFHRDHTTVAHGLKQFEAMQ